MNFLGSYQAYFLFIFERLINQLLVYFRTSTCSIDSGIILVILVEKLLAANDKHVVQQILHQQTVRLQYHALLYTCLSENSLDNPTRLSLIVRLWNLYGRIVD
jgi:hypothetical protein